MIRDAAESVLLFLVAASVVFVGVDAVAMTYPSGLGRSVSAADMGVDLLAGMVLAAAYGLVRRRTPAPERPRAARKPAPETPIVPWIVEGPTPAADHTTISERAHR